MTGACPRMKSNFKEKRCFLQGLPTHWGQLQKGNLEPWKGKVWVLVLNSQRSTKLRFESLGQDSTSENIYNPHPPPAPQMGNHSRLNGLFIMITQLTQESTDLYFLGFAYT